jgi:dienelactone hydrolase
MLNQLLRGAAFATLALILGAGIIAPNTAAAQFEIPVIALPEPTGAYAVGRVAQYTADETREEIFTADENDVREIAWTIHYPAATDADASPYVEGPLLDALIALFGPIGEPLFAAIGSHAVADAPLAEADAPFPVLIFAPGMGTLPLFYTSLIEEIASHGYVVASVTPSYSVTTAFPDGRTLPVVPEALPIVEGTEEEINAHRDRIGAEWTADVIAVLDQLALLNADDPRFAGRLDLERVGAFGHSFGGATAAAAMIADDRFVAGIDMDGSLYGPALTESVEGPFMLMFSQAALQAAPSAEELAAAGLTEDEFAALMAETEAQWQAFYEGLEPGYWLTLADSGHNTYITDLLFVAAQIPGMATTEDIGTIAPERAFAAISAHVIGFFDQHVKGDAGSPFAPLLDGLSEEFPEITFGAPVAE